ncbi:MAG: hypothetical protein IT383_15440 [Deltaproteobacteria bacterium]|nr:hypothetical protein [Deltaproteobacteria bacterium]
MTVTNKLKTTLAEAKHVTKELQVHAQGAHSLDVARGKQLLSALTTLKKTGASNSAELGRVINQLSRAIENAKIDPSARSLPPGLAEGGWGPRLPPNDQRVIFKVRADDPTPGTNFHKNQVDQLKLALELGGLSGQLKNQGAFSPPVGVRYEAVTLENRIPVDGAKLTAYVAQGAVGSPQQNKLDGNTKFFLESEHVDRRSGKTVKTWGGPFELGVAAHPLATTAQARAREYAMAVNFPLSRSDGVSLKAIGPERSDGKCEVKLDVHHFMDGKNVRATITALVEVGGGDFVKGSYTMTGAKPPKPSDLPAALQKKLEGSAHEFARNLGFPMLMGNMGPNAKNTSVTLRNGKKSGDGFEVTFDTKNPTGQIHANVDKNGKLQSGWFEVGKVPQRIEGKLDEYGEIWALADKAGQGSGHRISRSHTVDLVSVIDDGNGTFRATLHVNHWRTGEAAWMANVTLDKDGNFKNGAVSQS